MDAFEHTDKPTPMTDAQKFFFDLRGWIILPEVISDQDEINRLKEEVYNGATNCYQGRLQTLLDHPEVVGILAEILSEESFMHDDCYSFRCESSFTTVRPPGWSSEERNGTGLPHVVRPPQQANAMRYQAVGGKIFSGLTRVVWELEEVRSGQGATSFLSGSHKAHFNYGGSDRYRPNIGDSPWESEMRDMMEDYSCPPGSVVIFTESLLHAANHWTHPDHSRCAVFNCYNSLWAQWHRLNLADDVVNSMPRKRRSLFRGVWALGGGARGNVEYSADNKSY